MRHAASLMIYCFDIDGTLCTNTDGAYDQAVPLSDVIALVNGLHAEGHRILLYTARGATTGIDWRGVTEQQLASWGVRYHQLYLGKPTADLYIDDRAINVVEWLRQRRVAAGEPRPAGPMANPDYLDVTYADDRLPPSAYPERLAEWLHAEVFGRPGVLVDVGCGRGEYLRAFAAKGYDVIGIDSARSAGRLAGKLRVEVADVERDGLPLPDRSVDYVYSKSVIEHLQKPAAVLAECRRVLKPGGTAVIMTPSWRHQSKVFYEDYTHVSPFTKNGLHDAMTVSGFSGVDVRIFWQLPYLWRHPWLLGPTRILGRLPLPYRPWYSAPWPEDVNKLIRFSKEAMLLAIGRQPQDEAPA